MMSQTHLCDTSINRFMSRYSVGAPGPPIPRHTRTQEAQLSQRDRSALPVVEYFAKSLKIIRNDTVA